MSKGKKRITTFRDQNPIFRMTHYKCNRCGEWVYAGVWKNDTHKKCDEWLGKRALRDRAEGIALSRI